MGDGSWSRRRYLKRRLLRRSGTETIADGKGVMISTILSPLSPLSPGYFNHLPRDFRNSSSTIGFKLHCCFQRGQVEENSRLWQYMFVRSWNFKGSERGALRVPRVFKAVIDVSESEVVEKSPVGHHAFHLSDSSLKSPPLSSQQRMGRNTEKKNKSHASTAQSS
jgi:hypothetical protein